MKQLVFNHEFINKRAKIGIGVSASGCWPVISPDKSFKHPAFWQWSTIFENLTILVAN